MRVECVACRHVEDVESPQWRIAPRQRVETDDAGEHVVEEPGTELGACACGNGTWRQLA